MFFLKNFGILTLFAAVTALAQTEESNIRNVCDTLALSEKASVTLKLASLEETMWYGDKALKKSDSVKVSKIDGYENFKPQFDYFPNRLPYSVTAACSESGNSRVTYADWFSNGSKWELTEDEEPYWTYIMDINAIEMDGYDETNTYNFLVLTSGPIGESFNPGELLASRTYEFQFDWWFASVGFVIPSKTVEINGKDTTTTYRYSRRYSGAIGMDSVATVKSALSKLTIPDSIGKVSLQVLHAVLMDERKIPESDNGDLTGLKVDRNARPTSRTAGQIRRLDGSLVAENAIFVPGVYYVKDQDGLWKKQMVLPR